MAYTREKNYSAFDILGPAMIGPSSSHTAGAALLGGIASKIAGGEIGEVNFTLYGSFAKTAKGHGTDRALLAGVLGLAPDDPCLRDSYDLAKKRGLKYSFSFSSKVMPHANTVGIATKTVEGKCRELIGASIGGGNILVTEIDGLELELTGEYPSIVVSYQDEPGVIAGVTQILSSHNVNVAFMRVFRHGKGQDAFMVIESDEPVMPEAIREIESLHKHINDVFAV